MDPRFFYKRADKWYCRKCIRYLSQPVIEDVSRQVDSEYHLSFELTSLQKQTSDNLVELIKQGKSVLLEAVCGAGKTELVYEAISKQLKQGRKVGFAIARRQVVIEIAERLSSVFSSLKVVPVCQGYTSDVYGDLIVCTTHQLYRYNNYFDLLIIDEPDAFPFKDNEVLHGFAQNSCRGSFVYLTATPDKQLKQLVYDNKLSHLYLPKRPSGKDLCVPETFYGTRSMLAVYGLFRLHQLVKLNRPVIVFAPTIRIGNQLYMVIKHLYKTCKIDSIVNHKDELISDFKSGKYQVCVSTTVLERGVTIPKVSVIVMYAENEKFDEASLNQMAGRVGRSVKDTFGKCYFLALNRSENIDNCLMAIRKANDC